MTDDEIIGMQFGRWTVLDVVKKYKNGKTYCKCQCSCEKHTIKMVYKNSLLKGESQSCGCLCSELKKERARSNHIGERFGNLVVKDMLYQYRGEKTYCLCDCDCGNEHTCSLSNLISGHTTSCGCMSGDKCWNGRRTNLVGLKFGNLQSGKSMSFGCMEGQSVGERLIRDILIESHVDFIPQKKFDDCRHINTLPFDFYLPYYNTCIEYDGVQHFKPIDYFGGEKEFELRKINDDIKTKYCENNKINLIRLPYTLSNTEIKEQILNIWNP